MTTITEGWTPARPLTGNPQADLKAAADRWEQRHARLMDRYRRELDVLFAADLDAHVQNRSLNLTDTQAWPPVVTVTIEADTARFEQAVAEARELLAAPDRDTLLAGLDQLAQRRGVQAGAPVGTPDAAARYANQPDLPPDPPRWRRWVDAIDRAGERFGQRDWRWRK